MAIVKDEAYYQNLRNKTIFDLCDDDSIVLPFLRKHGILSKEFYNLLCPKINFGVALILLEFAHAVLKDKKLETAMREQFKYEISLLHKV